MRNIKGHCVKPLWVCSYYDGPLDGFCQYRGKNYFFVVQNDDWMCFMHPLKEETWYAHLAKRCDFEEYVGTDGNFKPQKNWSKFYDKYMSTKLPPEDELPPTHRFWMYQKSTNKAKFLHRRWRLQGLRDAKAPRCQSSTGT